MLKSLSAALIAASLIAAPVLATSSAQAASPVKTLTTKPVAKVVVKHKGYALHVKRIKHVRYAGHWKWVKVHGKFVKIFVRNKTVVHVRKPARIIVKKPVKVFKQTSALTKPATASR